MSTSNFVRNKYFPQDNLLRSSSENIQNSNPGMNHTQIDDSYRMTNIMPANEINQSGSTSGTYSNYANTSGSGYYRPIDNLVCSQDHVGDQFHHEMQNNIIENPEIPRNTKYQNTKNVIYNQENVNTNNSRNTNDPRYSSNDVIIRDEMDVNTIRKMCMYGPQHPRPRFLSLGRLKQNSNFQKKDNQNNNPLHHSYHQDISNNNSLDINKHISDVSNSWHHKLTPKLSLATNCHVPNSMIHAQTPLTYRQSSYQNLNYNNDSRNVHDQTKIQTNTKKKEKYKRHLQNIRSKQAIRHVPLPRYQSPTKTMNYTHTNHILYTNMGNVPYTNITNDSSDLLNQDNIYKHNNLNYNSVECQRYPENRSDHNNANIKNMYYNPLLISGSSLDNNYSGIQGNSVITSVINDYPQNFTENNNFNNTQIIDQSFYSQTIPLSNISNMPSTLCPTPIVSSAHGKISIDNSNISTCIQSLARNCINQSESNPIMNLNNSRASAMKCSNIKSSYQNSCSFSSDVCKYACILNAAHDNNNLIITNTNVVPLSSTRINPSKFNFNNLSNQPTDKRNSSQICREGTHKYNDKTLVTYPPHTNPLKPRNNCSQKTIFNKSRHQQNNNPEIEYIQPFQHPNNTQTSRCQTPFLNNSFSSHPSSSQSNSHNPMTLISSDNQFIPMNQLSQPLTNANFSPSSCSTKSDTTCSKISSTKSPLSVSNYGFPYNPEFPQAISNNSTPSNIELYQSTVIKPNNTNTIYPYSCSLATNSVTPSTSVCYENIKNNATILHDMPTDNIIAANVPTSNRTIYHPSSTNINSVISKEENNPNKVTTSIPSNKNISNYPNKIKELKSKSSNTPKSKVKINSKRRLCFEDTPNYSAYLNSVYDGNINKNFNEKVSRNRLQNLLNCSNESNLNENKDPDYNISINSNTLSDQSKINYDNLIQNNQCADSLTETSNILTTDCHKLKYNITSNNFDNKIQDYNQTQISDQPSNTPTINKSIINNLLRREINKIAIEQSSSNKSDSISSSENNSSTVTNKSEMVTNNSLVTTTNQSELTNYNYDNEQMSIVLDQQNNSIENNYSNYVNKTIPQATNTDTTTFSETNDSIDDKNNSYIKNTPMTICNYFDTLESYKYSTSGIFQNSSSLQPDKIELQNSSRKLKNNNSELQFNNSCNQNIPLRYDYNIVNNNMNLPEFKNNPNKSDDPELNTYSNTLYTTQLPTSKIESPLSNNSIVNLKNKDFLNSPKDDIIAKQIDNEYNHDFKLLSSSTNCKISKDDVANYQLNENENQPLEIVNQLNSYNEICSNNNYNLTDDQTNSIYNIEDFNSFIPMDENYNDENINNIHLANKSILNITSENKKECEHTSHDINISATSSGNNESSTMNNNLKRIDDHLSNEDNLAHPVEKKPKYSYLSLEIPPTTNDLLYKYHDKETDQKNNSNSDKCPKKNNFDSPLFNPNNLRMYRPNNMIENKDNVEPFRCPKVYFNFRAIIEHVTKYSDT